MRHDATTGQERSCLCASGADAFEGTRRKLAVAVASHKPCRVPQDPCYIPVRAGAALHPDTDLGEGYVRDDEGDGISEKNASYCELTALYWLWRNVNADAKGLVHYRRFLGSPDRKRRRASDAYDRAASEKELTALLSATPVVAARHRDYVIETISSHYAHTMKGGSEQLDAVRAALSERWPEYVSEWDAAMRSTKAHLFNVFVMKDAHFDAYCSWLFEVLEEVERRVDSTGMSPFEARWPGRIAEFLLDPWLAANRLECCELPIVSPEPVNWLAKARGFLAAKFLGKNYEGSF